MPGIGIGVGVGLAQQKGGGAWWLPAAPVVPTPDGGTIYVSGASPTALPAGNDTTGNGSAASPYATLSKAISTIATSGNKLVLCDGTFAESTNGGGRWIPNAPFTAPVVFRSYSGSPDGFIISNSSGTTGVINPRLYPVSNLWIVNATLRPTTDTHTILYLPLDGTNVVTGLNLADSVIEVRSSTGSLAAFFASTDTALSGLQFIRCSFKRVAGASTAANPNILAITPSTLTSSAFQPHASIGIWYCNTTDGQWNAFAANLGGIDGLDIIGSTITASVYALMVGRDTAGGTFPQVTNARVWGNTLEATGANGHGLEIGENVIGADVAKNIVSSSLQGIVVKGASGAAVRLNTVTLTNSVNGTALYAKASQDTAFTQNTVEIGGTGAATAFREGVDGSTKAGNTTLTGNTFQISGASATALQWADGTGSTGGAVSNDNNITLTDGASLGSLRGTAVSTQSDLPAAWAAHGLSGDDPSNDSRSLVA